MTCTKIPFNSPFNEFVVHRWKFIFFKDNLFKKKIVLPLIFIFNELLDY